MPSLHDTSVVDKEIDSHDDKKELRTRCPPEVCSVLQLQRKIIVPIMDKHNVDSLTFQEAQHMMNSFNEGTWKNSCLDDFHTELFSTMEKKAKDRKLEKSNVFENRSSTEDFLDNLLLKITTNPKSSLSWKEQEELASIEFYFMKDYTGIPPKNFLEAMEYVSEDKWLQYFIDLYKIDPADHSTYPFHYRECDGAGKNVSCEERIKEISKQQSQELSIKKASEMAAKGIEVGDVVLCSWDSKLGVVTKTNKISYRIEIVSRYHELIEVRFSPLYVKKVNMYEYPNPRVGDIIHAVTNDGFLRDVLVKERKGLFFLGEWTMKSSKEVRTGWLDPLSVVKASNKEKSKAAKH